MTSKPRRRTPRRTYREYAPQKSHKAQAVGVLVLLYAIACGLINFGLWHPWLIGNFTVVWNPPSLLTPQIVGNVPIIGGSLGAILNGVFAAIWSLIMLIFGGVLLLK